MCVKKTTQQKEDFNTALSLLKDIPIDSEDPFEDIFSLDNDDPTARMKIRVKLGDAPEQVFEYDTE